ncbi:V-type proton ATPase, partial [Reticulomyxa filosa]
HVTNDQHICFGGRKKVQENRRDDVGFKYIAGVVTVVQRVSFERQVFLTSRGNSLVQFGETVNDRMVFAVFFLGNQLQKSLRRLCQYMNIYVCYESDSETSRELLLQQVMGQKTETQETYIATRRLLFRQMRSVARRVQEWKITLLQEKGIRMTLNKFRIKSRNNVAIAEGWCATVHKSHIRDIMENVVHGKGVTNPVMTDCPLKGIPPTYFEQTEFTAAFQSIVDTYGVPRYKEFNPAIPTIVTFPFLFGVMYGDIFHGSCLLLFAILLVNAKRLLSEQAFRSEFVSSLYFARYVLLFMGMFSVYCGVIYNDCMSIMINGWNSAQWQHGSTEDGITVMVQRNVYAVGIDPSWSGVDNQLTFSNSLKMKLSVIIGVLQMTFGLFLKLSNHLQERDFVSVFFEFVPQLVFMVCFFGYMVFLIFYKWCINWSTSTLTDTPSLITVLINMFLSPGSIGSDVQIFGDKDLQATIQVCFLLALVISIPAMLCIKPCILRRRMRHAVAGNEQEPTHSLLTDSEFSEGASLQPLSKAKDVDHHESKTMEQQSEIGIEHEHEEEESFGDIVIHQLIHTIEYVLGTISNTASYLRLWALSLAHAELSEVFLDKTLRSTMKGTGIVAVLMNVAGVFGFLIFTCGVLLIMDVLECFLHALRLHWVEFQNKFFYADGRAFHPFAFSNLLHIEKF